MSIGLSKSEIEKIITREIPSSFPKREVEQVAKAVAAAISKNNAELEKELNFIRTLTGK